LRTEPIRRCWPVVSAASMLVLVSCAEMPTPTVEDGPATAADIELAPRCEGLGDVPLDPPAEQQPDADASLTTAEPIDDLDGVEQDHDPADGGAALEQARGWAEREAGDAYAGMWLDQAHGAVVFAFTEDVDRYAAGLRERFGDGLWVTRLPHGRAELLAVQAEIDAEELPPVWEGDEPEAGAVIGTGQRDPLNRVIVTVFELDEPRLAELSERYGADLICVEDGEPPQPLVGEVEDG
jgi:hypothetical protein